MRSLFATMFSIVTLIYFNLSILRSVRNALIVADAGSAELFVIFELWAALPSAVILTFLLTRLCRRFALGQIFTLLTLFFILFFSLFAFWIYPAYAKRPALFLISYSPATLLHYWPEALFFSVTELWKASLLSILFWTAVNRSVPIRYAERIYGPLLAGGSLGAICSGPIIAWCTKELAWQQSLQLVSLVLILASAALILLFRQLMHYLKPSKQQKDLSLQKSLQTCLRSPGLLLLLVIVLSDYLAYGLAEILFLNAAKTVFPQPVAYCHFMGHLTFYSGLATLCMGSFLSPRLLSQCSWQASALVTPVLFLSSSLLFFSSIQLGFSPTLAVGFGSLMYCLCRSAKYTFFDSTKELAYMHFTVSEQLQGKLVIDGMGGHFGRSCCSIVNLSLIHSWGSIAAAAPMASLLCMLFISCWTAAVCQFRPSMQSTE